ncbi:MAG TPA: hypothetical protein VIQ30_25235 [Pseudonocardia sp.]
MPSIVDPYLVGKLGAYCCPTIAKIDEAIVKLTAQIATADRARRERIWADVDLLLERRSVMSLEAAL